MKSTTNTLDATKLPSTDKRTVILQTLHQLSSGESLILVNDHDPRPLLSLLKQEYNELFSFEYVENGPTIFKIKITKR